MNNLKKQPQLSIVIPVYNEAENIKKTIQNIYKDVKTPFEIFIVYDSAKDTTIPIVKKLQSKYKRVYLLKNTVSNGPSGALRAGIARATAERVLVMMADLCDDTTQIDRLCRLVPSKAAIACPSRYTKGGKQELNAPFKVGLPKTAGYLLRLLTGINTYDPTNSFKLYSSHIFKNFSLTSTISFSVTLEIVAKAHCLGYKIIEIPTIWRDRQFGKTNFKLLPSLAGYLPWFGLALLRNKLFTFPKAFIALFVHK